MTEDRDPGLLALFAEGQETLEDEAFVAAVMQRAVALKRYLLLTCCASIMLLLGAALVFSWPLLGLAMNFTSILSTEIFVISNGVVAWLCTPVNNLATLLFLVWRILRFGWARSTNLSYIN